VRRRVKTKARIERRSDRVRPDREVLILALGAQLSALLSASRALTAEASAVFHPDLPPAAFHIARWLHAFGSAKVSSVAEAVAMDRSATSRLTARLVDLGMIEARPDPSDGRGVVLKLTDRGRKRVSQALVRKGDVFRQRIDGWHDADLELLADLLRRFNDLPQNSRPA
jgi:DNA-binding MarR family transcriptional regulator